MPKPKRKPDAKPILSKPKPRPKQLAASPKKKPGPRPKKKPKLPLDKEKQFLSVLKNLEKQKK
ncbi:MAG: protein TolA, partial [Pseudomonadota bacterium]|nr:protein TolA [Pseudomonadota bacterium]